MELLTRWQTPCPPSLPGAGSAATALRAPLLALLRRENVDADSVEISLVLCDDPFIQDLNRRYRGKNTPTDVLSFAQEDPAVLGDIIISLDAAQRQADAAGWPLSSELALLAVHGLLHLLGEDDENEAGAARMQQKTVQALTDAQITLPPAETHPFLV